MWLLLLLITVAIAFAVVIFIVYVVLCEIIEHMGNALLEKISILQKENEELRHAMDILCQKIQSAEK